MTIITSKQHILVKNTKKLYKKKYRVNSYLIEGWHLLEEAIKADAEIIAVFATPEYKERLIGFPTVYWVSPIVMVELSDSKTPQGVIAQIAKSKSAFPDRWSGRYLFLERIQDPGNVGTMIRTADAAGFDGVILSEHSVDLYHPKLLRSMQGSHFHLPIYQMTTVEFIEICQVAQLPILATGLSKQSVDYREVLPLSSFALAMGNEGKGISPHLQEVADWLLTIPMKGHAESLNVAVAAGILMFF